MKSTPGSFRKKSNILKNNRGLKKSSQQWLQRQLNDPFVQQAKLMGLRSRAAFKLMQIQEKYNIINKIDSVIDLGAAPGGWAQVVINILDKKSSTKVFALDLLDIKPIPGVTNIKGDFTDPEIVKSISNILTKKVNVVLSDMAPSTSGHKDTDHIRIMHLAELAFEFAKKNLKKNGNFVTKIFQGGMEKNFSLNIKRCFNKVNCFKPSASRKESTEMYLIARGFKDNIK